MNTRERILRVSLFLFNDEGESHQTALDISNTLEISPGNLYYHFKGKDAIIRTLFDHYEEEVRTILLGSRNRLSNLKDKLLFLYIILEETYDFRFFYRNLDDLLFRYPDLADRFRTLQSDVHEAIMRMLADLSINGERTPDQQSMNALSDQVMLNLNFWLAADAIREDDKTGQDLILQTVRQIMCLIAPYMKEGEFETVSAVMDRAKAISS